jgi:hypothetical protein
MAVADRCRQEGSIMKMKTSAIMALLGVTAWVLVGSCKSTGHRADAPEQLARAALLEDGGYSCPNGATVQADASITLTCCGLVQGSGPVDLCLLKGGYVEFTTSCAYQVGVSFLRVGFIALGDGGDPYAWPLQQDAGASPYNVPLSGYVQNVEGLQYQINFVYPPLDAGVDCFKFEDPTTGTIDIATSN